MITIYDRVDLEDWWPCIAGSEREFGDIILLEPSDIREYLNDNSCVQFVEMEENGEVLGRCLYIYDPTNLYRDGTVPTLQALYVFPEARGKGVATKLVEYCFKINSSLKLFTRQTEVHKICENLGFKNIGTEVGHYSKKVEVIYEKLNIL